MKILNQQTIKEIIKARQRVRKGKVYTEKEAKKILRLPDKETIYVLGNPTFEKDYLPIKLLPKLKKFLPQFEFQHLDPTENLPEQKHLILIDTILSIDKVKLLNEQDLEKIQSSPNYSLHDFDLGFQLKLMKKLNKIKKVTIIGVPSGGNEKEILKQIKNALNSQ